MYISQLQPPSRHQEKFLPTALQAHEHKLERVRSCTCTRLRTQCEPDRHANTWWRKRADMRGTTTMERCARQIVRTRFSKLTGYVLVASIAERRGPSLVAGRPSSGVVRLLRLLLLMADGRGRPMRQRGHRATTVEHQQRPHRLDHHRVTHIHTHTRVDGSASQR